MDIDAAGVVGRFAVALPVIISEPAAFVRDDEEIAAALVEETFGGLLFPGKNIGDAVDFAQHRDDLVLKRGVVEVDIRDLVIGDREDLAVAGIDHLASKFVAP